ncbi:hypothetical protein HA402_009705 [Bradysia odoriphaga]|nr:hypothetical protein HA402_009705 [Bradysia odoriphaga]
MDQFHNFLSNILGKVASVAYRAHVSDGGIEALESGGRGRGYNRGRGGDRGRGGNRGRGRGGSRYGGTSEDDGRNGDDTFDGDRVSKKRARLIAFRAKKRAEAKAKLEKKKRAEKSSNETIHDQSPKPPHYTDDFANNAKNEGSQS